MIALDPNLANFSETPICDEDDLMSDSEPFQSPCRSAFAMEIDRELMLAEFTDTIHATLAPEDPISVLVEEDVDLASGPLYEQLSSRRSSMFTSSTLRVRPNSQSETSKELDSSKSSHPSSKMSTAPNSPRQSCSAQNFLSLRDLVITSEDDAFDEEDIDANAIENDSIERLDVEINEILHIAKVLDRRKPVSTIPARWRAFVRPSEVCPDLEVLESTRQFVYSSRVKKLMLGRNSFPPAHRRSRPPPKLGVNVRPGIVVEDGKKARTCEVEDMGQPPEIVFPKRQLQRSSSFSEFDANVNRPISRKSVLKSNRFTREKPVKTPCRRRIQVQHDSDYDYDKEIRERNRRPLKKSNINNPSRKPSETQLASAEEPATPVLKLVLKGYNDSSSMSISRDPVKHDPNSPVSILGLRSQRHGPGHFKALLNGGLKGFLNSKKSMTKSLRSKTLHDDV